MSIWEWYSKLNMSFQHHMYGIVQVPHLVTNPWYSFSWENEPLCWFNCSSKPIPKKILCMCKQQISSNNREEHCDSQPDKQYNQKNEMIILAIFTTSIYFRLEKRFLTKSIGVHLQRIASQVLSWIFCVYIYCDYLVRLKLNICLNKNKNCMFNNLVSWPLTENYYIQW